MNAAKEIALLFTSLTAIQYSQTVNHSHHHPGLLCSHCERVTDPLDCKYTTYCDANQACHVAHFATSQGNLFYRLGCKNKHECHALHNGRRANGETLFEEKCCTKHPECNRDIYKKAKEITCGSCKDMAAPAHCEKVSTCDSNEVCGRIAFLSDELFLRYNLECIKKDYCGGHVLHRALTDDEVTDLCCDIDYCNMGENMNRSTATSTTTTTPTTTPTITTTPFTTTTKPTTTTMLPTTTTATTTTPSTTPTTTTTSTPSTTTTTTTHSTTTTTHSTTTPTTTPSTTTTTTTTTPSTTTTTTTTTTPTTTRTTTPTTIKTTTTAVPAGVICQVCDSFACFVSHDYLKCDYPTKYCYTNIKVSSSGQVAMTKKCASKQTCEKLWWQQTSDREECVNLHQHLQDQTDFSCDYCCVTDKCNTDDVPPTNTLYRGA